MSVERDPDLGKALELALGPANAPYGAKLRVRRKLAERLSKPSANAWAVLGVTLASIACASAIFFWLGRATAPTATNASAVRYSELMLSSARVLLRDDAVLRVERDDATGAVLRLKSGAALVHVQKGTGKSFEVFAGATRVRVVGTVFGVALGPRGVAVDVQEGVVEVHDRDGGRTLRAGETWPPRHGLFDPAALERVRAPLPPGATGKLDDERAGAPPVPPESPADEPSHAPNDAVEARPAASVGPSRPPARASAAPESAYSRARSLERAGDAAGALTAYQAIVEAHAENVEDALFALGRLRAQQGDQRAALSAAKSYRSEFPSGRYARDNDVLVLNAELALGEQMLALGEAERFLERFPNDPRAWRFRLVRAADRARRGDCAGARSDVETAPDGAAKRSVLERCASEHP